jgi:hypothetical protein
MQNFHLRYKKRSVDRGLRDAVLGWAGAHLGVHRRVLDDARVARVPAAPGSPRRRAQVAAQTAWPQVRRAGGNERAGVQPGQELRQSVTEKRFVLNISMRFLTR